MTCSRWTVLDEGKSYTVETSEPGGFVLRILAPVAATSALGKASHRVIFAGNQAAQARNPSPKCKRLIEQAMALRSGKVAAQVGNRERYVVHHPAGDAPYAGKGVAFLVAKRAAKTADDGRVNLSREAPGDTEEWVETDRWSFRADGDVRPVMVNGIMV